MKLAPPVSTLQPLPPDVHAAVSQNAQRVATPADIQTIQNVQIREQSSAPAGTDDNQLPVIPFVQAPSTDSIVLWAALIIAVLVAAGAAWLWRSF